MTEPLDLTAGEIAAGVKEGRFSAVEIAEASLRRAHAAAQDFNAFVVIRDEAALAAARSADEAVKAGQPLGPLHGVPFLAKDLTPTEGDVTTLGSWSSGDYVPETSALMVRRLQAAGGILIGKTTSPEFAHSSLTWSPRYGATRNPRAPDRTSGGSSGGSAASVAAGVVPFAEGTDMGGSIRIPASFCGVVGLKPSLGRIPMTILPSLFDDISHFGPLARTVDDAARFMAVAAGPSDEDPLSLPLSFDLAATAPRDLSGMRFALSMDLSFYAVAPGVEAAVRRAVDAIRDAGGVVEEIELPWTRAVVDRWVDLWAVFMSAYFGDRLEAFRDRMDPAMVELIEQGRALGATEYKRIELLRSAMWRDLARVHADYDALVCPTCAVTAPPIEARDGEFMADDGAGKLLGLDMTCPFNMTPHCPALSLPVGRAADGLPVGLQIVGRRHQDETLLGIARSLERLGLDAT
jgi:Asp-tRNA(Asn)/Glu-tRNA(Gln) amidotransferase A subunit family amidase